MKNTSIRTLFISKDLPYPPMGGSPLRNWQNVNIMKSYGPVVFFSLAPGNYESNSIAELDLWRNYNRNRRLSFWERLKAKLRTKIFLWYSLIHGVYADAAARDLDEILTKFQPQLVVIVELTLCLYLPTIQRHKCLIIFDDHNVEADIFKQKLNCWLKENSPSNWSTKKASIKGKIQFFYIRSKEKQLLRQSDRVWVCSQEDADLLKKMYGSNIKADVVPNTINIADYEEVRSGKCSPPSELKAGKQTLIFVGSFGYQPNLEAAEFLINQIYPKLKETYPDCHLLLVGKNPPKAMQDRAKKDPGIICTGTVPDVKPYLAAASAVVTPLFQGGGTRLKILEAFAASRPVVSTSKGAEGLLAKDGEHLLIGETAEEIVEAICKLWSEPSFALKLTENAYELVKAEYSWEAAARKIEPLIEELF